MNGRTQAIIGATVVLLGVGVVLLGLLEDEQRVRQVADVVASPAGHFDGEFVLIGTPQPAELTTPLDVRPNALYRNTTTWSDAFMAGGTTHHAVHTLHVEVADGISTWTHSNRTQEAGRPQSAVWANTTWIIERAHTVFLIQGFPDGNGETPWIWGVYDGVVREPIQPKPWQFTGHLTRSIDGTALPADALVFQVTEYATQCSSKFLPDDHESE